MRLRHLIAFACALALPSAMAGTPIMVWPSADAFTSTAHPDDNYGGAGIIALAAPGLANGGFNGVMQFDLGSAKNDLDSVFPTGWNVESVMLTVSVTIGANELFNPDAVAGQFTVKWLANDGWTEGTGNPNAPGTTGINNTAFTGLLGGSTETLGTYSYDGNVTGTRDFSFALPYRFVEDIRSGGLVSLAFVPADEVLSMFFRSRSFKTFAALPFITITAGTSSVIATSALPATGGSVSGAGTYTTGTETTLLATPHADCTFLNWTQDGIVASTAASYTFTAGASRTLVAHFALIIPQLSLRAASPGVYKIEWPAGLPNWTLQESTDLVDASWRNTSRAVSVVGDLNQVTSGGSRRFFRLKHTP